MVIPISPKRLLILHLTAELADMWYRINLLMDLTAWNDYRLGPLINPPLWLFINRLQVVLHAVKSVWQPFWTVILFFYFPFLSYKYVSLSTGMLFQFWLIHCKSLPESGVLRLPWLKAFTSIIPAQGLYHLYHENLTKKGTPMIDIWKSQLHQKMIFRKRVHGMRGKMKATFRQVISPTWYADQREWCLR